MPIIEPAIRPPAEAGNFLLQITTGCSANRCAFCGAYSRKPFAMKNRAEITADIQQWRKVNPGERRVFLMDGDALAIGNELLLPILERLSDAFPKLARVASYANGYNITRRTDRELTDLFSHKLRLIYLGLESGSQEILTMHRKRSTATEMVDAVRRAGQAGIKSSVMVLLGLGGMDRSALHVKETIAALNRMQPRYLSFLTLMVIPGTPLSAWVKSGSFQELGPSQMLLEAREMVAGLELDQTVFRMDHASNYLQLEGKLPGDRARLLNQLDQAIDAGLGLRPESLRGL